MKVAPLGEVKNYLTKFIELSEKEPIFITRNGKISAVLEHITDDEIEDYLLDHNTKFHKMLNKVKSEKGGMRVQDYRKSRNL